MRGRAEFIPKGLVIDLDGVVCDPDGLLPGAKEALSLLEELTLPFVFLTNDAANSRRSRAADLASLRVEVPAERVLVAGYLAAQFIIERGPKSVLALVPEPVKEDLRELPLIESGRADCVIMGDIFEDYQRAQLDSAFDSIIAGADFIALQRNRTYMTAGGPRLDAGFWVEGMAYCTGHKPTLVGKPSLWSYTVASRHLGLLPAEVAMLGDSVEVDLAGARAAGMVPILIDSWGEREDGIGSSIIFEKVNSLLEYVTSLADHVKGS